MGESCMFQFGHFLLFLPFFIALFLLGSLKGMIMLPITFLVLIIGNTLIILSLWPLHVTRMCCGLLRTKQLGPVLKSVLLLFSPLLFILWPTFGILGSLLFGLGYGFFSPLLATFEAVRQGRRDKFMHCFVDGTWSTIKGSCTVVRDFFDLCYYSYFSYLDDFCNATPPQLYEIKVLELPGCFLVGLVGVIVDVPIITLLTVTKSPIMLVKGWGRLLQDFLGWDGPFLETVCVPFAALAILLWPLAVIASAISAVLCSIVIGLYAGVIVYEESSVQCGLSYIIAMIAEFDEYSNDVLYICEGSCLPRPKYRKNSLGLSDNLSLHSSLTSQRGKEIWKIEAGELTSPSLTGSSPVNATSLMARSKSLKQKLQDVKVVQIWDNIFMSCEHYGRVLMDERGIAMADLEEWTRSPKHSNSRIIGVGLLAYSLICNLINSAKAGSSGFLLLDAVEMNTVHRPQDRIVDWFFEPLLILKEQIKAAELMEGEELYLKKRVLTFGDPVRMEAWLNGDTPPDDEIRKEELNAYSRRIQGIATSISRFPTFRRRYQNVIKALIAYVKGNDSSRGGSHRFVMNSESDISSLEECRYSPYPFGLGKPGTPLYDSNLPSRDSSDIRSIGRRNSSVDEGDAI